MFTDILIRLFYSEGQLMYYLLNHISASNGNTHEQLRDRLMQNYGDVFIRPVKNASTATKVTVRPLFQNLIEMVRFI